MSDSKRDWSEVAGYAFASLFVLIAVFSVGLLLVIAAVKAPFVLGVVLGALLVCLVTGLVMERRVREKGNVHE